MRLPRLATSTLALALTAVLAAPAPAAESKVVGGDWLIIEGVDARGRAPFNPDALRRRYLLDRGAPPPAAADSVRGTKDAPGVWKLVSADEKGAVGEGRVALAYRAYESAHDQIVLADVRRGASLIVNGTPYVGDVYGGGMGPVPVALRKGRNHLYVRGVRGKFTLTFTEPEGDLVVNEQDTTAPDFVDGVGMQGREAAVVVANCTTDWMTLTRAASGGQAGFEPVSAALSLRVPPLGVLKVPVPLRLASPAFGSDEDLHVPVHVSGTRDGSEAAIEATLSLRIRRRAPTDAFVRTFRSAIDGSVQEYAVRDSADGDRSQLVLSVHGAGVGCRNQANAYSARPGVQVVAATNRRPFGFDWQDWGRLDAYEVLEHALAWSGADRSRVCLTGHSMGGHGTWHLAANDPDGFAAIAPSAGWSQFDHYGGRPDQARREPWYGADAASDTMSLLDNLVPIPTFVLHGTKDDNVPLSEAQRMLDALRERGGTPQAHFQEDAGHWWNGDVAKGADCVDWPPIFELFAESRIPDAPRSIAWTTVDPVVDPEHHWVRVEQPLRYGKRIRIDAERDVRSGSVVMATENARLLRVTWPGDGALRRVVIDGQRIDTGEAPFTWLRWDGDAWCEVMGPREDEKGPRRSGPFKRAFDNRVVLVVGTAGTDTESRALLERARYDSQAWRYRGNGLAEVVTDSDFAFAPAHWFAGRNVIVYGNADTNAAWDLVFEGDCPIRARRGALTAGRQTWERDDVAAVFVQRRRGDSSALAAAFADTGAAGTRLHGLLLTFVSGVGYPDYAVFTADVCERADDGVLAAGWFDHRWKIGRDGRD